jgi:hypothetical protein
MALSSRVGFLLAIVAALVAPASGQHYDRSVPAGGPFSRVAVVNAPFAADATTRVTLRLPDGSPSEHTVTARYYRDSQGRVRADVDTPWGPYFVLEIPPAESTPGHIPFYVLDPVKRTYRIGPPGYAFWAALVNGEARVALPVGRRACFQIAPPVIADASDEQRLQAVHAQVSADIGIVTASHRADAIALVDYQVTNIRRGEPGADLFELPADYTLVQGSLPDDPVISLAPWQSPPACQPIRK